jgi:hypothetical protein
VKAKPQGNAAILQAKAREIKAAAAAGTSSRAYQTLGGEAGGGALQSGVTVAILSGLYGGSVGKITNSFGFEAMVGIFSSFQPTKFFTHYHRCFWSTMGRRSRSTKIGWMQAQL